MTTIKSKTLAALVNGPMPISSINRDVGGSLKTLRYTICELEKKGIVVRCGKVATVSGGIENVVMLTPTKRKEADPNQKMNAFHPDFAKGLFSRREIMSAESAPNQGLTTNTVYSRA